MQRYMAKEEGRKAVAETNMPQLVSKKMRVSWAIGTPNLCSTALGGGGGGGGGGRGGGGV